MVSDPPSETIRMARPDDAADVTAIYAPVVRDTPISFELDPPGPDEMRQRIVTTMSLMPWLVLERDRQVIGYAYAAPHHSRLAYQWSVDVSVYVAPAIHRHGIGRKLYTALLGILHLQGFYTVCAGITLPNEASVGLHESLGFQLIGVYRNVGYKTGSWRDVGWWGLSLREHRSEPTVPRAITDFNSSELEPFLNRGH